MQQKYVMFNLLLFPKKTDMVPENLEKDIPVGNHLVKLVRDLTRV